MITGPDPWKESPPTGTDLSPMQSTRITLYFHTTLRMGLQTLDAGLPVKPAGRPTGLTV